MAGNRDISCQDPARNTSQVNKKITEEVAEIQSKRLRNKIAGFTTHLMKRIQKGPVRGISLKLQEEERERRMEYVPDRSEVPRVRELLTIMFHSLFSLIAFAMTDNLLRMAGALDIAYRSVRLLSLLVFSDLEYASCL